MGKRITKEQDFLVPGDLVVYKDSHEAGILMQKHKVLRTVDSRFAEHRWYYAWRIMWNKEIDVSTQFEWTKRLESSLDEEILIREIKEGKIQHYRNKDAACNL
jgi:thiamine biosynthesis protein ThiC